MKIINVNELLRLFNKKLIIFWWRAAVYVHFILIGTHQCSVAEQNIMWRHKRKEMLMVSTTNLWIRSWRTPISGDKTNDMIFYSFLLARQYRAGCFIKFHLCLGWFLTIKMECFGFYSSNWMMAIIQGINIFVLSCIYISIF